MGDSSVKALIDRLIQTKKVFVIEKRNCPFCKTAKKVLGSYDIPDEFIEYKIITGDPNMSEIQDYMSVLTGERTVPRVFINGKCVGGGNEVASLHKSKELENMLRKSGAIV